MRKTIFTLGLMLAAALSLTSCSKNEEATFTPEVKVPFELYANMDDTRTTNEGLSTKWAADDAINVFHAVATSDDYKSDGSFSIEDATRGLFNGNLSEELTAEAYDWYAIYPYVELVTTPANKTNGDVYIGGSSDTPQVQNGNNSTAHIAGPNYPLVGVKKNVLASDKPAITMSHISSLVEFEVTNKLTEDITVTSIALTALEDIVGTYYIDFTGEKIDYTPGDQVSQTATLNVSNGAAIANGQSAKFYMAIKPTEFDGDNILITINASTANGKGVIMEIEKEVETTFYPGKVKTLKVNFNAEIEEPKYNMISTIDKLTAGQYYMAAYLTSYDGNDWAATPYHLWNGIVNSGDLVTVDYSFNDNVLETSSSDSAAVVTLEAVAGKANTYYVKCGGKYLYSTQSATNRKLALSTDPAEWVATDNANGGITLSSNSVYLGTASASSRLLRSYNAENKLKAGVYFFAATDGEVTPDPTPEPDPTPDPEPEVKVVTVAEFLAAAEDSTIYELTGVITRVDNIEYGNFDLTDDTGTVYIYGLCSPSGVQKYWAESGAKVGDTITVRTVRTSHNSTPQGKNAIFVSLIPGEAPDAEEKEVTVAEFLAANEDATIYTLKGTITAVANTTYGNFDLTDDTGTVLIYGLCSPEGAAQYWAASGAKIGDDIVVKTVRTSYNGTPQGKNATFVELVSPGTRAFWSFEKAALVFGPEAEEQIIKVDAYNLKSDVTVASDNSQFSATYESGILTVSALENTTTDAISGNITVTCGTLSQVITITQSGVVVGGVETDVERTMASFGWANSDTVTEAKLDNNVTVKFAKGGASTAPAYYTNNKEVRLYQNGATMTIDAGGLTIKSIVLTFVNSQYYIAPDCGTFSAEGATRTWTGEAKEVKFTTTGTDKDHRAYISKIKVTYISSGEVVTPDPEPTPDPEVPTNAYTLLKNVSDLTVGDKIVIAAKGYDYAMSTEQKTNNRGAAAITKSGDIITFDSDVQILTVAAGKVSGTFAFNTGSGYLYAASGSSNHLKTKATLDDNGSWSVEIAADGTASLKAQGSNSRNVMQYNPNNGSPLFTCYSSASQQAIAIYRLEVE